MKPHLLSPSPALDPFTILIPPLGVRSLLRSQSLVPWFVRCLLILLGHCKQIEIAVRLCRQSDYFSSSRNTQNGLHRLFSTTLKTLSRKISPTFTHITKLLDVHCGANNGHLKVNCKCKSISGDKDLPACAPTDCLPTEEGPAF